MEKSLHHSLVGLAVQTDDLNALGKAAALADDRVLAELLRMTPYDGAVSRGILAPSTALIAPGAAGTVTVAPFRALIGSRTAVATEARENHRDIRSGLSVAEGATALNTVVPIAANASGQPRWDLILAKVMVEQPAAPVIRKHKSTTTGVVSEVTISHQVYTDVSIVVVQGTPAAAPVWPDPTPDSGSTYYVPLGYVRVQNGFGTATTVLKTAIAITAPALHVAPATGANSMSPPSSAVALTTAQQEAWGASGSRPGHFMPSTAVGGESLLVYLDLQSSPSTGWSHQSGDVIDSRDWRGRLCKWTAMLVDGAAVSNKWWVDGSGPGTYTRWPQDAYAGYDPDVDALDPALRDVVAGVGHTLGDGYLGKHDVLFLDDDRAAIAAGTALRVYVDAADGKLKFTCSAVMSRRFLLWLEFSGPMHNL